MQRKSQQVQNQNLGLESPRKTFGDLELGLEHLRLNLSSAVTNDKARSQCSYLQTDTKHSKDNLDIVNLKKAGA